MALNSHDPVRAACRGGRRPAWVAAACMGGRCLCMGRCSVWVPALPGSAPRSSRCQPPPARLPLLPAIRANARSRPPARPPQPIYPTCLRLAHGTRVCQLRVDEGETLVRHVLPLLVRSHPQFANDVVLFNFG